MDAEQRLAEEKEKYAQKVMDAIELINDFSNDVEFLKRISKELSEKLAKIQIDHDMLIRIDTRTYQMEEFIREVKDNYVSREEFTPVQKIVYGVVWVICSSVGLGLLGLLFMAGRAKQ